MFTPDELFLIAKVLQGEIDTIRFIQTRVPALDVTNESIQLMTLKRKALVMAQQPAPATAEPKPAEGSKGE